MAMSATFSRTLRSLQADAPRAGGWLAGAAVLLLGWAAWLTGEQVPVYEVTDQARLEVTRAAHPVTAAVGGRVVETRLVLGRAVEAGEILVVLDAEAEQRALHEKEARRQALAARSAALRREIQTEQDALRVLERARAVAQTETQAQAAEAQTRAVLAERKAETSARLWRQHAASAEDARHDQAEAEARRAAARALRAAVDRQQQDRLALESDRRTRLAKLEREWVEVEGDRAVETAALRRLEHDLALRQLRAPIAGRVGAAAEVRVGTVVGPGEKLGAVVPAGERRAVALFPAAAVGQLRPGLPARLRLDGFPWTQYGTLRATVADVGTEATDGRVRVELTLAAEQETCIPVEHGLTGSAEVEVERLSPAALTLRAAGQMVANR
jgi:membrane fusion protein (multidrug efflux system)